MSERRVSTVNFSTWDALAGLFKTLGDRTRIRILMKLGSGSASVSALVEELELPQPTVSHQLRILRGARLVKGVRSGKQIHYSLDDKHVMTVLSEGLKHSKHGAAEK